MSYITIFSQKRLWDACRLHWGEGLRVWVWWGVWRSGCAQLSPTTVKKHQNKPKPVSTQRICPKTRETAQFSSHRNQKPAEASALHSTHLSFSALFTISWRSWGLELLCWALPFVQIAFADFSLVLKGTMVTWSWAPPWEPACGCALSLDTLVPCLDSVVGWGKQRVFMLQFAVLIFS